jgi:hypothetical protein
MDSEWWDRPAYDPCPRRRSGLLGDIEYDYDVDPYPQQQVPHWVPPSPEEDEEEEEQVVEASVLPVEQCQPPNLSEGVPAAEPIGGGHPPTGHRGERARRARELGGPRGAAGRLGIHKPRRRIQQPRRPTITAATASCRAPAQGLRCLGVAASRASHSGELGALGLC